MAYKAAKELLCRARTPQKRQEAIREAMRLGMPLHEIEQFLDWLDSNQRPPAVDEGNPPSKGGPAE